MITRSIGVASRWLLDKIVDAIAATGVNPNVLTAFGMLVNLWAAVLFATGMFRSAAAVIFLAGFLDMLDGQVARREKRVTAFGAFFDSTLDRYSDMALYMGLLVYYAVNARASYVILAAVATAGSVMVSYASARAESMIQKCDVGFLRRPERVVLFIIGALSTVSGSHNFFANRMPAVLWVLAVGSYWTFAHRMYHTWREVNKNEAREALAEAATNQAGQTPELRREPSLAHKAS